MNFRMRHDCRPLLRAHPRDQLEGAVTIHYSSHTTAHAYPLQKQGVLPLWFADKADYGRIGSGDVVETLGLADLLAGTPGATIRLRVTRRNGETFEVPVRHTMSADQVKWLLAGSALNHIRAQITAGAS